MHLILIILFFVSKSLYAENTASNSQSEVSSSSSSSSSTTISLPQQQVMGNASSNNQPKTVNTNKIVEAKIADNTQQESSGCVIPSSDPHSSIRQVECIKLSQQKHSSDIPPLKTIQRGSPQAQAIRNYIAANH